MDRFNLDAWDEASVNPGIVWLSGDAPDGNYWQRISTMSRITVTINHPEGPTGLWIVLKAPAIKLSKYPFRCRHHKC